MRGTSKSTTYIRLDDSAVANQGWLCVLPTWNAPKQRKTEEKTWVDTVRRRPCTFGINVWTPTHPTISVSEAAVAGSRMENNSDYSLTGIGWGWIERRQSCCNILILLLTGRALLLSPKHSQKTASIRDVSKQSLTHSPGEVLGGCFH